MYIHVCSLIAIRICDFKYKYFREFVVLLLIVILTRDLAAYVRDHHSPDSRELGQSPIVDLK